MNFKKPKNKASTHNAKMEIKITKIPTKKYGTCRTILIKKIAGREQVILIQNAFPTLEKYIQSRHTIDGKFVKISSAVEKEIINNFEYMLSLKLSGLNLFFTDIDYIKNLMIEELK